MEQQNMSQLESALLLLMEQQVDSLEKQTFGGVTQAELREYDERQERIHALCDALDYVTPAA
jgi:hypothetical protein